MWLQPGVSPGCSWLLGGGLFRKPPRGDLRASFASVVRLYHDGGDAVRLRLRGPLPHHLGLRGQRRGTTVQPVQLGDQYLVIDTVLVAAHNERQPVEDNRFHAGVTEGITGDGEGPLERLGPGAAVDAPQRADRTHGAWSTGVAADP